MTCGVAARYLSYHANSAVQNAADTLRLWGSPSNDRREFARDGHKPQH